jgi:hypothetical protein
MRVQCTCGPPEGLVVRSVLDRSNAQMVHQRSIRHKTELDGQVDARPATDASVPC